MLPTHKSLPYVNYGEGTVHNLHENKNLILYEDLCWIIVSNINHFIQMTNKCVFPVLYVTHEAT